MIEQKRIDEAVAVHQAWRARLQAMVVSGKVSLPTAQIRVDTGCDFGRWLTGPDLTSAERATVHYRIVVAMHSAFHLSAADVAELVELGRIQQAVYLLAPGGEFDTSSRKLIEALRAWATSLPAG